MAKPIIKRITPFDGDLGTEIEFMWTGERSYANRVIICNNKTNETVYDETVQTCALKHVIPGETLENGKVWSIQAQVFDREQNASALSDKILFYTFHTPDFYFKKEGGLQLEDGQPVDKSSYQAAVYYHSPDAEKISSYAFYLYDNTARLLSESSRSSDVENMVYTYKGLENDTEYYIQCKGITANGMELDTGLVKLYVKYQNPSKYSTIHTTAIPDKGCVQVSSNIILIQYNGDKIFDFEDGLIDLNNDSLFYDEGFLIDGDFSLVFSGKNLWQTAQLFTFDNGMEAFHITSRIYTDGKLRFRLSVPNGISNYILYSEPLNFTPEDMVTVLIKRSKNVYGLETRIEGGA